MPKMDQPQNQARNPGDDKKFDPFLWEKCKENIQPLSQGRKIESLIQALTIASDKSSRQKLISERKSQFDKDLEDANDDDSKQLDVWVEYIDWLEQNVPDGGKVNGITNAIERCIELYHDKRKFKQDMRLFSVFMKFKRFCDEPTEVFGFMYANSISTLLARFYLNWSWQYEIKKNVRRAEEIIKLGLKNLASPRDVLEDAETQLKCRVIRMTRAGELDDCIPEEEEEGQFGESGAPRAPHQDQADIRNALNTLKFRVTKKRGTIRVPVKRVGAAVDLVNVGGLKSQTKIVNGVRVPKKVIPPSKGPSSNKTISIFNESGAANQENAAPAHHSASAIPDATTRVAPLMPKIPTSQPIQSVGRSGSENQVAHTGNLLKMKSTGLSMRRM